MSSFVYGQGVSPITTHVLAKAEGSPVFAEPEGHGKQPLWVARLTLTDFRCYRDQRIEIDSRPVVLAGPNGAGKTNVLEALSFLVPGRGLRGATIADVARRRPGGTVDTIASGACASSDGVAWAVAARVIGENGGRVVERNGGKSYEIKLQAPAIVEPLVDTAAKTKAFKQAAR